MSSEEDEVVDRFIGNLFNIMMTLMVLKYIFFRIPWRRFALDSDDAAASESEDEIFDKSLKPAESSSQSIAGTQNRSPKKLPQSKSQSSLPSKSNKSPSKSAVGNDPMS